MHDFDWLDNEVARHGALWPARAPSLWLARLGVAAVDRERLARATATLDLFRRAPWMADSNPLAVLQRGIVEPDGAAPAADDSAEDSAQRPVGVGRLRPALRPAFGGEQPGGSAPAGSRDHVRGLELPGQSRAAAVPTASAHRPLPSLERTTVSTQQLGVLASDRREIAADARSFQTRAGAGQSGTGGSAWKAPAGRATSPQSSAAGSASAGARPGSPATPARQPNAPTLPAAASASSARLPGLNRALLDTIRERLPDSAATGAALLARLTEPVSRDGDASPDMSDLARRAIAQAFRETIGPETLPAGRLAALATGRASSWDAMNRADRSLAPAASVAAPGRTNGAPAATTNGSPAGLESIALLRESLAGFGDATTPASPERQQRAPEPPSATPATPASAPEHPRPPDLLAPAGGAPSELPAVQNTFNVTVHMAGGLDNGEEELADRLTRILVEQARRYGIDI